MKEKIILMLAGMLIERLDPEMIKEWADMGLDLLENQIEKSENVYDDQIVLPIIKTFRESFQLPDND